MKLSPTACLAFACALAACSSQQQQQAQTDAQQLYSSAPDAAKDAYLTAAVASKLAAVDVDAATSVQIAVQGGVATLSGQAHDRAERDRYDAAAKSVDGIVSVRDAVAINPRLRGPREQTADTTLQARVSAAIAAQAGVNVFQVTPTIHGTDVTLAGTVPSRSVARTIVETVRGVTGVTGVDDRLVVHKSPR
jgi:osmotically-inducible protein OsmY